MQTLANDPGSGQPFSKGNVFAEWNLWGALQPWQLGPTLHMLIASILDETLKTSPNPSYRERFI